MPGFDDSGWRTPRVLGNGLPQGWGTDVNYWLAPRSIPLMEETQERLGRVLCGGDLSGPQWASEDYFLNLEREAFLELCKEPKTVARIWYMLQNNKPLRN